ncbi:MAG: RNA polymerase sigma factor [Bacteroidales bacterium]
MPEFKPEISSEILKGCLKGKLEAQKALYKQFYAYGMSICLRYSHNRDEAAEIMNDSFLKVFNNLSAYKIEFSFRSWFRRIIINTAIDNFRKNKKFYNHYDEDLIDNEVVDNDLIDEIDFEGVMALMNELPEHYRLTFNLFEIEGYSHEEIAKIMGIAESTSRSNLTRAKKILRNAFLKLYKRDYAQVI